MPNFYHWRTLAGAEVDIIVEIDGKLYSIEVKSTSNVTKADIKGLEAFFSTYPNLNVQNGIVIYAGKEVYRVKENIIAVPWDLCLRLLLTNYIKLVICGFFCTACAVAGVSGSSRSRQP